MAYSRSESTLRRILPELQPLAEGRTHKWNTDNGRAWWYAGKIREGLYIAREIYPHKYPKLALAAEHYTVEVLDDHTVQARPTANTPATAISDGDGPKGAEHPAPGYPTHGLELVGGVPRTIVGQKTATDIIAFCLRAMPTNDKLVFTEVELTNEELNQIARWAATRTPRWMLVWAPTERIATLGPWQPGIPAWNPQ